MRFIGVHVWVHHPSDGPLDYIFLVSPCNEMLYKDDHFEKNGAFLL